MWLGIWCSLGTVPGMYLMRSLVEKSGKTSYFLLSLIILILISAVVLPTEGILQLLARSKAGFDVFQMQSLCG